MADRQSSQVLKAIGETAALLRFDTARTSALRVEQREQLAYHIARLIVGEGTAASEWKYFGVSIEVEPDW